MSRGLPALPPVAVMDWGIGGFGVVRALLAQAPGAGLAYVSDSGFVPYGKVPAELLARRVSEIARSLHARGVRHLVVACNAASTVVPRVRFPEGLLVTDVVAHGLRLLRGARCREVGLVGGRRTVLSGVYRRGLADTKVRLRARIAQPLSALIERGELDTPELHAELARIVAPLRGVPALLLACTHYPAIAPAFRAALPGTRLLDPAGGIAEAVLARGAPPPGAGGLLAFTTGDPTATRRGARRAFGVDPGPVRRLAVDGFADP